MVCFVYVYQEICVYKEMCVNNDITSASRVVDTSVRCPTFCAYKLLSSCKHTWTWLWPQWQIVRFVACFHCDQLLFMSTAKSFYHWANYYIGLIIVMYFKWINKLILSIKSYLRNDLSKWKRIITTYKTYFCAHTFQVKNCHIHIDILVILLNFYYI